ncbi:MAG TPA: inositol monophosphatase family protein [Jatrophihabitantaceae bacterium]|nr:inositol monophosphatase family protein [Jatrophihabitantaceae bacterium]
MSDDVELAASLVREAGTLAAAMLLEGLTTKHKTSISDVVSAADHAAEDHVVDRLRTERPGDGVVGEEGANSPAARTWFVDPVDGTYNFLSGLPTWCAAVALTDPDGTVLGAVYQPTTDELWVGGRDTPTTLNGVALTPMADRPLAELSVASYLHPTTLPDDGAREPLQRVWQRAATVRMLGSGSVELASVASGRLGAWVQIDSLEWDWLPGAALVQAAGGTTDVFTASGHRWHVAGPPTAVAEIAALIRGEQIERDLPSRLRGLVDDAALRFGSAPRMHFEGDLITLTDPIAATLEAALAEALDNVIRHAYASTIDVSITVSRKNVVLVARDDGVGPNDEPTTGAGLRITTERAEALGGSFTVEPNEPLGTTVTLTLPR